MPHDRTHARRGRGYPEFPRDRVSEASRHDANRAFLAKKQTAVVLRDQIPMDEREVLAEHYWQVAWCNASIAKRSFSEIQVKLQIARANFLLGNTDEPPGNATQFNDKSLR